MKKGGFEADPFARPMTPEEIEKAARGVASGSPLPTPEFWRKLGFHDQPMPGARPADAGPEGEGEVAQNG